VRKFAGDHTPAVMGALGTLQGPERLVDFALRSGPYGDRFGLNPDGLSLERVRASPGGIDLGELAPRLPEALRTPSGKVELAPPELVADLQHALAELESPAAPLVLIGRRDVRSNNSWMHNLPTLAKGPHRCTALVHPDDAAAAGVGDGALARLSSASGHADVVVSCTDAVMRGVVSLPHGWGHDDPQARLSLAAERPGVNLNALLTPARDPLSGNAVLAGEPVRLEPVGSA
jgi:anaerobic selenocysteine-containing dehydrogenase